MNPRPKIFLKRPLASLVRFSFLREKNKNLTKFFSPRIFLSRYFSDSMKNTKARNAYPFKKRQAFLKRRCFKQQLMQVEMFCWHFCLPGLNAVPYGLQALFSQIFVESLNAPFYLFSFNVLSISFSIALFFNNSFFSTFFLPFANPISNFSHPFLL